METLYTKRLKLRALSINDLDAFYNYAKKPHIGPMAGWEPHKSIEDSLKILQSMIKQKEVWGITLKDDDTLIGTIGLHCRDEEMAKHNIKELGYVLNDTYWNQGLMTEAAQRIIFYGFNHLKLDKILCGHYIYNVQSKRVIEKLGFSFYKQFEKENHAKEKVIINMYEMTKKDFEKRSMKNDNIR